MKRRLGATGLAKAATKLTPGMPSGLHALSPMGWRSYVAYLAIDTFGGATATFGAARSCHSQQPEGVGVYVSRGVWWSPTDLTLQD